jgi:hypothetical protein
MAMAKYDIEVESESDYETTVEDDEHIIPVNTSSNKFKKYKIDLLGNTKTVDNDAFCESYKLEDVHIIKYFVKKIKSYVLNDELDEQHIKCFLETLLKEKKMYFLDRVSLVQYNDFIAPNEHSLIEIINGHHRIEALKQFYENVADIDLPRYKICLRLDIYNLDNPTSDKTMKLFRNFNAVRPQNTYWPAKTLTNKIIGLLNSKFSIKQFTFIKDNEAWTMKPSILMKEIARKMEKYLEEQLKTVKYINERNIESVNLDNIIQKFVNYNNSLSINSLDWFNDIKQREIIDNSKKITSQIFEKAKKYKCLLGFVKINHLINQCVKL